MRSLKLFITFNLCIISHLSWAKPSSHQNLIQPPTAEVTQSVLGGDILLINMKEYLVISGEDSKKIIQELGSKEKYQQLTKSLVNVENSLQIKKLFQISEKKPTALNILNKYENLLNPKKDKLAFKQQ